ncbi:hypothetical protein DES53_11658 [Roseimicrobium gellanilyticum]|uniref:Uncharacterized protein n=1 Tax=Roseimicrobium gellanilyticum TaxID=748857 RepID=A0A366H4T1_9BACT|nr:hypothetical protein DES53_11658 [Roseimicrobium gellanilyticum]
MVIQNSNAGLRNVTLVRGVMILFREMVDL